VTVEQIIVDAELVDDAPPAAPVPVDAPTLPTPTAPTVKAPKPVLPPWLQSRSALTDAALWAARHSAHVAAFHGLRLPLYYFRIAGRAPVGTGRILAAWGRWIVDADGRELRQSLKGQRIEPLMAHKLTEQRQQMFRARLFATVVLVGAISGGGWLFVKAASEAAIVGVVMGLLTVLGLIGRRADRRLLSRSVDKESVPRLTADLILTALGSLGIGELNKSLRPDANTAVRFPSPIMREGPGFRAEIDLPPGVTAGDVIERRDRLASGLRRPQSSVWPSADPDAHAGRLIVWVGDKPMSKSKPVPWPLVKSGKVDLFEPFPIGVSPQGKPVTVTLMYALAVIGAIPRMGKTFFLRLLGLAAALDPTAELHAYGLKGGADLSPLESVAHRFRSGDEPDDLGYLKADVRAMQADMRKRYKTLKSLDRQVCPEGKVTRALADRRGLGLWPVVLLVDECQLAFDGDPELVDMVTDLGKRGPAAGIMVVLATQRVDAKSLPTAIGSNAVLRFCLKVAGQVENDMVLGTSMYKSGVRATTFARTDYGVGYLAGEGDEPSIVRTAYVNAPTAEAVAARARAARLAAGLLTGHAADQDPDPDESTDSILDHLAAVWPSDEEKVWWDDLAELLEGAFPGLYGAWTGEQVTAAVRPHGLTSIQIKRSVDGRAVNRRGLARQALALALADRDDRPEIEQ
jgi:S-DNA-T family DNA segregation ATPase FtsK/SpoIIIE